MLIRSTYSAATFRGPMTAVQGVVDALDDLAEVALVLGGVGPGRQLALDRRLGQESGVGNHGVDGVDALVQVVLDLVEVAVVGVGDLSGGCPPC